MPACLYECFLPFCSRCTSPHCICNFRSCWTLINGHLHCLFLTSLHPLVFDLKLADVLMSWKAFLQREGVYWQTGWPYDLGGRKCWWQELFSKHLWVSQHHQVVTLGHDLGSGTYVAAPWGLKTSRRKTHVESERWWLLWTHVSVWGWLPWGLPLPFIVNGSMQLSWYLPGRPKPQKTPFWLFGEPVGSSLQSDRPLSLVFLIKG